MSDTELPTKPPSRGLAIGLAIAAVACLVFASFTNRWLVNDGPIEKIGFGLRGVKQCRPMLFDQVCRSISNADFVEGWVTEGGSKDEASSTFAPMGWATLISCLLAAVSLLGATGIAIARKQPQWPMTPTTSALLAIMAALITGCVFVAIKPGPPGYVGVLPPYSDLRTERFATSFWVFGVGAVLGIAAAQLLAKVNRPADPDLLDDAMDPDEF